MPRKGRSTKTHASGSHSDIFYADASIGQLYAFVKATRGNCNFTAETLGSDEIHCSLTGTVKRYSKICVGDLVLVEPLSDGVGGNYIIIRKYDKKEQKRLEKEGKLKTIEEPKEEEEEAFFFEGQQEEKLETTIQTDDLDWLKSI